MIVEALETRRTVPKGLVGVISVLLALALAGLVVMRQTDSDDAALGGHPTAAAEGTTFAADAAGVTIGEQAIPPGTYRYRVVRQQAGSAPQAYQSTAVVIDGTEERDHTGTRVRREYTWHGSTRIETAMTLSRGDYRGRCAWAPGLQSLVRPIAAGAGWTTASSCNLGVEGGTVVVSVHENTRVAEITVDAVRLERTARTTSTAQGRTVTRSTNRTEWLSPRHGLLLRAVERYTEVGSGSEQTIELTEELVGPPPG